MGSPEAAPDASSSPGGSAKEPRSAGKRTVESKRHMGQGTSQGRAGPTLTPRKTCSRRARVWGGGSRPVSLVSVLTKRQDDGGVWFQLWKERRGPSPTALGEGALGKGARGEGVLGEGAREEGAQGEGVLSRPLSRPRPAPALAMVPFPAEPEPEPGQETTRRSPRLLRESLLDAVASPNRSCGLRPPGARSPRRPLCRPCRLPGGAVAAQAVSPASPTPRAV